MQCAIRTRPGVVSLSSLLPHAQKLFLQRISKIEKDINALEEKFKNLSNEDFPKKTLEFKNRIKNGETLDQILPDAFALVREASNRSRNERHYDVQLVGGVVLHENKIADHTSH